MKKIKDSIFDYSGLSPEVRKLLQKKLQKEINKSKNK